MKQAVHNILLSMRGLRLTKEEADEIVTRILSSVVPQEKPKPVTYNREDILRQAKLVELARQHAASALTYYDIFQQFTGIKSEVDWDVYYSEIRDELAKKADKLAQDADKLKQASVLAGNRIGKMCHECYGHKTVKNEYKSVEYPGLTQFVLCTNCRGNGYIE